MAGSTDMVHHYVVDDDIWKPGTLLPEEWHTIEDTIAEYGVKTVLEFGSGISTYCFRLLGLEYTSYEDKGKWLNVLRNQYGCTVTPWKVAYKQLGKRFDMCFVDGPHSAIRREIPFKMAAEHSDIVVCHDTHNKFIKQWERKYLGSFNLISELPHLHVWKR